MSAEELISKSQKKLKSVLGDKYKPYHELLKRFFSCGNNRLTKDEFDDKASDLFTQEMQRKAHYEFLFTILNGTSTVESVITDSMLSSTSSNRDKTNEINSRKRKLSSTEDETSNSCDSPSHMKVERLNSICSKPLRLEEYIPLVSYSETNSTNNQYSDVPTLPCVTNLNDVPLVYCRALVMAWEDGLNWVEEKGIQYLLLAIRQLLKAIVMAVGTRRKRYQLRENRFQYAVGSPSINIYIGNTQKERNDCSEYGLTTSTLLEEDEEEEPEEEQNFMPSVSHTMDNGAAFEIACDTQPTKRLPPVSAWDLFDALQVHRDIIPSHSVYAPNMELILSKLYHSSEVEMKKKQQHDCDTALWRSLKRQEEVQNRLAELEKEQNEQKSALDDCELEALQKYVS